MKKILVIDDDKAICWLLEKLLSKKFSVTTMTDRLKAMRWLAERNIPDLIITDIDMPKLNGFELMENLQKSGIFRDIPVVILSGWDSKEQRIRSFEEGASNYLLKPFDPNDLLESIEEALVQKQEGSHV